jgi:hypothetical protein
MSAPTVVVQEAEVVLQTRVTRVVMELSLRLEEVTNILAVAVVALAALLVTHVGAVVVQSAVAVQAAEAVQVYMTQHMTVHP